jgi:L-ascorbate metabolism protein UlaG (beta-lactamase superfamily)
MFGPIASPVSFAGPKRYSDDMLDMIEEMPPIDAVFITHDHYDHLDYQSKKVKEQGRSFLRSLRCKQSFDRLGCCKR